MILLASHSTQNQGAETASWAYGQMIEALQADSRLGANLRAPSISYGTVNLYMRGVLEEATAVNLSKPISELVGGDGSLIQVRPLPCRPAPSCQGCQAWASSCVSSPPEIFGSYSCG